VLPQPHHHRALPRLAAAGGPRRHLRHQGHRRGCVSGCDAWWCFEGAAYASKE
jgi:hypothetical protein